MPAGQRNVHVSAIVSGDLASPAQPAGAFVAGRERVRALVPVRPKSRESWEVGRDGWLTESAAQREIELTGSANPAAGAGSCV